MGKFKNTAPVVSGWLFSGTVRPAECSKPLPPPYLPFTNSGLFV